MNTVARGPILLCRDMYVLLLQDSQLFSLQSATLGQIVAVKSHPACVRVQSQSQMLAAHCNHSQNYRIRMAESHVNSDDIACETPLFQTHE